MHDFCNLVVLVEIGLGVGIFYLHFGASSFFLKELKDDKLKLVHIRVLIRKQRNRDDISRK